MVKFKLWNNIVGWFVFAIAAATYLMTIEPTASFWDCGEFIASAYKLEVGHPPGAPLFLLTARVFSLFASDPTHVAMMVNSLSALCSAFTILFLFWTITHLARKVVMKEETDFSVGNMVVVLGAGAVGALAYTFSDSFWFSAVEGEVYAYSSLFTAVVFWCILKWEEAEDNAQPSMRWIILTAYLMGLSIGVHLLNLLAIPTIVLVYYFKKSKAVTIKGIAITVGVAIVILIGVLYGLIPGFTKVAGQFELFFVNVLGLPFNTGLFIYLAFTIAIIVWALWESHTEKNPIQIKLSFLLTLVLLGVTFLGNTLWIGIVITLIVAALLFFREQWNYKWIHIIVLCMTMMLVGYSTYAMIMIRSAANPPMDQNSPEDVFSLQSYLNREQYGDRPLFYGANFNAPELLIREGNICRPVGKYGNKKWVRKVKDTADEHDQYVTTGRQLQGYEFDPRFKTLFPRMYSNQAPHVEAYKSWGNIHGKRIQVDRCGTMETRIKPTFGENLRFFFSYQCHFMYWRYFMWNFSGRQNDMQGFGELDHGNWITGFNFIDNSMLGDQSKLPEALKNNKGHNRYFMLPLLLGILGIIWQLNNGKRGKQHFWITLVLFFMTGLAIVMYLNQTPYQPRERDYSYAGSFYAFCIWVGLGILQLWQLFNKVMPKAVSACIVTLLGLCVPALMAAQNWDDHDRSNRYIARDIGHNYLNSCASNAILFCNGDNDTFPVWYAQEVEGDRTDIRSCNLSYLSADWYISQMKRGAYESKPLPISWSQKDYMDGHLDIARVSNHPQFGGRMPLATALELLKRNEFIEDGVGNIFASKVTVPVERSKALQYGGVADTARIVSEMEIPLGNMVRKSDMMVLEMIHSNQWERPMYISVTVGNEFYPKLQRYMQLEGLAYRIVPADMNQGVNVEAMYDNMMHKFRFGNMKDPKIYIDETSMRSCQTLRVYFGFLARALNDRGDTARAREVLDYCMEQIPQESVPYSTSMIYILENYYRIGAIAKADAILQVLVDESTRALDWVLALKTTQRRNVSSDMSPRNNIGFIYELNEMAKRYNSPLANKVEQTFNNYYAKAGHLIQQ